MPPDDRNRIFITGASGFVGRYILDQLGDASIVALDRSSDNNLERRPNVTVVQGDVTDPDSLQGAMDGCATVIHLAAIINERGSATFDTVIRQGTENMLAEASNAGIDRFIHMSALGAQDNAAFPYLQAKWRAEQAIVDSGVNYTIFRPSVIFGPGDGFINALAGVVKDFPIVPVVGDGLTAFQPVYVREVANAFARAVEDPGTTSYSVHELGGGKVYTYEEMLDLIQRTLNTSKRKVHLPVGLMKAVVSITAPFPSALRPPVTTEQLKMLAVDNTTGDSSIQTLIGTTPVALEDGIDYIR